jgi:hypothetical protein
MKKRKKRKKKQGKKKKEKREVLQIKPSSNKKETSLHDVLFSP